MSQSGNDAVQQQEAEQSKRKNQEEAYGRANRNLANWYKAKFEQEQHLEYDFGLLDEPIPDPGKNVMAVAQPEAPKVLPTYGVYDVTITDKNALIQSPTKVKINYTAKGVRPNEDTPEAWRACIAFLAQKTLCESVVLTVPEDPHDPQWAADRLKSWMRDCINLGVAAELSGSSQEFLFSQKDSVIQRLGTWLKLREDTATEIKRLRDISHMALAEARVERATQWIAEEKLKVESETTERATKWAANDLKIDAVDANSRVEDI